MSVCKLIDRICLILYRAGGILLLAIMVCVVLDVAARAIFSATGGAIDLTFPGGIELVKYGLLFAILLAFPYAIDKGQLIVDLFTQKMSPTTIVRIDSFYTMVFGVFGGLLCWRFVDAWHNAQMSQELTQDLLIPLSNIYFLATIPLGLMALRGVSVGLAGLATGKEASQ